MPTTGRTPLASCAFVGTTPPIGRILQPIRIINMLRTKPKSRRRTQRRWKKYSLLFALGFTTHCPKRKARLTSLLPFDHVCCMSNPRVSHNARSLRTSPRRCWGTVMNSVTLNRNNDLSVHNVQHNFRLFQIPEIEYTV